MDMSDEEILNDIYFSIKNDLNGSFHITALPMGNFISRKIEDLCEQYTKVCFNGYRLQFTSSNRVKSVSRRALGQAIGEWAYVGHARTRTNSILTAFDFSFYSTEQMQRVFPFVEFKIRQGELGGILFDNFYTEWFDPKLLLTVLPTRRKFIDEILADLEGYD